MVDYEKGFHLHRKANAIKKQMKADHEYNRTLIKETRNWAKPREIFNRWRDSAEGKEWKYIAFKKCGGRCQCGHDFGNIGNAVIHHNLPIEIWGNEANFIENFSLLCHSCNSDYRGTNTRFNEPYTYKTYIF